MRPQETVFEDRATGLIYSRVAAGVVVPRGTKPGFVAAVGKKLERRADEPIHDLHVVGEMEVPFMGDLYRVCRSLQKAYSVQNFYGDNRDDSVQSVLAQGNYGDEEIGIEISLVMAPCIEETGVFQMYVAAIRNRGQRVKSLFFHGSEIPREMRQMLNEDVTRRGMWDFPKTAALGMAVSAMDYYDDDEAGEDVGDEGGWRPMDEVTGI